MHVVLSLQLWGQTPRFSPTPKPTPWLRSQQLCIQIYEDFPFVVDMELRCQLEARWQGEMVLSAASRWMFNVI